MGAVAAWVAAALGAQVVISLSRRAGNPAKEIAARRRVQPALVAEHVALVLVLLSGAALLLHHRWGLGHARWLAFKLGLVAFLVVPLEAFHAYVCHSWLARGLRQTPGPPFSREFERAVGMDDMIRVIAGVLLGVGLPLIFWLSLAKPF